jgi:hypothetical protein
MKDTCQLLLCEVRYEARGHIALLSTALYLKQVICRHPATNIEASLTHLLINTFTHPPFTLSPFGFAQGKLRRRALISNFLINSPFVPLPAAFGLCRKASAGRHPVDCGLASVLRRGAFAQTSCLLFSTGWSLIVRAENKKDSHQ